MSSDATYYKGWKGNPYLFTQYTPTPPYKLSISNMSLLFVLRPFNCFCAILLSVLIPSSLKSCRVICNTARDIYLLHLCYFFIFLYTSKDLLAAEIPV